MRKIVLNERQAKVFFGTMLPSLIRIAKEDSVLEEKQKQLLGEAKVK